MKILIVRTFRMEILEGSFLLQSMEAVTMSQKEFVKRRRLHKPCLDHRLVHPIQSGHDPANVMKPVHTASGLRKALFIELKNRPE